MITLPELLTDSRFKSYFCTPPKQGPSQSANWRIYVQRTPEGRWLKKDFENYADAFRRLGRELKAGNLHDGAIQSRGIAYAPPQRIVAVTKGGRPVMVKNSRGEAQQKTAVVVWRPRLSADDEVHTWCPYCRRPTVFQWFLNHHSTRGSVLAGITDPSERRCTICGAREDFVRSVSKSAWLPGQTFRPKPQRRKR